MNLTSSYIAGYKNTEPSEPRTANPSKPNQSQSEPGFSAARGPQSQNEPKQTQSKPNFKSKKILRFLGFAKMPQGRIPHPPHRTWASILNAAGGTRGTSKTGLRLNTGLPCRPRPGNCGRNMRYLDKKRGKDTMGRSWPIVVLWWE